MKRFPQPLFRFGSSSLLAFLPLLCILLFASPSSLYAEGDTRFEAKESSSYTTDAVEKSPALCAEVEQALGLKFTGPVGISAFETKAGFNRFADRFGGARVHDVLGVYVPPSLDPTTRQLPQIALNVALIREISASLESVLKHELCHAILEEHILDKHRPLWFEEGVAQWVSETPIESALGAVGYGSGVGTDPTSFYQLSSMLRDPQERGVAYAHALAALEELEDDFGADGVREFLAALANEKSAEAPRSFPQVFEEVFQSDFSKWADSFLDARNRPWWLRAFQLFGRDVFSSMMVVGVVLLMIAWWRKTKRESKILDRMVAEEAAFPSGPDWAFHYEDEDEDDGFLDDPVAGDGEGLESENADQGEMAKSSVSFKDEDGYWTEDGWVQKDS